MLTQSMTIRKLLLQISACISLMGAHSVQSLDLDLNTYQSIVSDQVSYRVGDPITVVVINYIQANRSSAKGLEDEFSLSGGFSLNQRKESAGLGLAAGSDKAGFMSTSGTLKTVISASISKVLDNDIYEIVGIHETQINDENQVVKIRGKIRSVDISSDNTIYSHKLSDALIEVSETGDLSGVNRRGVISKVLSWLRII